MLNKTCKTCGASFVTGDEELRLYEKFEVDPVDLCFECEQKRRICFRNERNLYHRICDGTGEQIISIYSQDSPLPDGPPGRQTDGQAYKVYKSDYWYGDKWDGLEYGRDFDFNRGFFEQMRELQLDVPRLALLNVNSVNSDYCNMTVGNKNCYLVFGGDFNEDCMYGTLCMKNIKTLDCDYSNQNQLCHMICDCVGCYECRYAFDCNNCTNCYFVSDCVGCSECILCTNLVKKSCCINNLQLSRDEYFQKKAELINSDPAGETTNFENFVGLRRDRIVKYAHIVNCQNSSGDYLKNCKECHHVFDASNSEDLRNVIFSSKAKDCFNSSLLGDGSECCYNVQSCLNASFVKCSYFTCDSSNIEYGDTNIGCRNLFGCVGLRHKKYCIFNKQYSREEYEKLRERIIEHMKKEGSWGEFFPKEMSCFGYNETSAQDYFPMKKEEALRQGFKWSRLEESSPKAESSRALVCKSCRKNFKILEAEAGFYKRLSIPTQGKCSDCRHSLRMDLRNPRKLWQRNCQKCGVEVKSSYSEERSEVVYCEKCYLETVH